MTRILLIETASPKRIRWKAEQIIQSGSYPEPDITILCNPDNIPFYMEIPGVQTIPFPIYRQREAVQELNRRQFDAIYVFWTGEKRRRAKLFAFLLKSPNIFVISGDGGEFRLTWKAICRHTLFRWKHPLPTDHYKFDQPQSAPKPPGEKILILQSAEPPYLLAALDKLKEKPVFRNPIYTVFCRHKGDAVSSFQGHPMIHQTIIHEETRGSWMHWRRLRKERFDNVIVFYTGDPSYRKIKLFAFMLGARHKLIFNESLDCFFFTWRKWLGLILHRMKDKRRGAELPAYRLQSQFHGEHLTDRNGFVLPQPASKQPVNKILILQSAEPPYVLAALDKLKEKPLFRNPSYTVFCRYKGDAVSSFQGHPMIHQTIIHVEAQDSWIHWRRLRKERFDGVIVFCTGDPSYRKIKFFAFMLGARHKLIFNENLDCFFFTWRKWLELILHRMDEKPRPESRPRWHHGLSVLMYQPVKIITFPFRFLWLLLIWLRLRLAGMTRRNYDHSL